MAKIDLETRQMGLLATPLLITALMLLMATGWDWHAEMTWHDQHRIEQIGLLIAVVLGGLTIWRHDAVRAIMCLPRWASRALVGAFCLGLLSAVISDHPRFAMLESATLLLLLGLVLLLGEQARRDAAGFDLWATRLVVALAVVIALKLMASYLAALLTIGYVDSVMLFEGTFSNRRFFGQVASMAVPLLAYPLVKGDVPRFQWWGLFVLLAVWWMLIFVSGTRGTWLALTMAALVLAFTAWRASVRWLKLQVVAASVGGLLFGLLFVWLPVWLAQDASIENRLPNLSSLNGRAELWHLAWAQIVAHPLLGIGPMHLASLRNDFGAHPHNALLQLSAEWGVPAALALILPTTAGMIFLLARLRKAFASDNLLLVCLTASLLAAGAQSMVDGVIVIPYTQVWLALVAGWALGVYFRGVAVTPVILGSHKMRLVIPVLSTLALGALLNGVFPEVLNRAEVTQAYVNAGNLLIPPRYWAVGWIPRA